MKIEAAMKNAQFDGYSAGVALRHDGYVVQRCCPGDATQYDFMAASTDPSKNEPYWVATQYGGLYGWMGTEMHWSYCAEKWASGHEWTGRIIAAWLTGCSRGLAESDLALLEREEG